MWGSVSCLREQHDGRDWASNHRPSDLKSNALTTTIIEGSVKPKCWLRFQRQSKQEIEKQKSNPASRGTNLSSLHHLVWPLVFSHEWPCAE